MAENCPKCLREINSNNRLVTELCGHLKCRLCLIFEQNQCAECELSTKNSDINENKTICKEEIKNNITIIENIIIEPKNINKTTQSNNSFTSHITKQSSGGFKCTICNKSFQSRNQKYYHLYCKNSETKPYKCTVCPRTFSSSYHLKYHLENHTGKTYKCNICSKIMANKITFEKHVKNHNILHKIYNCDLCSKKYKDLVSYKDHLNKHNNIYPYSCDNCDKIFSSNSNLIKHKKIYTVFEKKFKCNQCGNTFFRKSSLKSHILKHSNKNLYNCNKCSKSFSDKKSLLRHQNVHNDAIQMYQCGFCDVKSVRKDNLLRHIRNMHPNENQNKIIKSCNNNLQLNSTISNEKIEPNIEIDNSVIVNKNTDEIVIASSVIRSIGNVKPLNIPNTNSDTNNISSIDENILTTAEDKTFNDPINTSTPTALTNKKIKKKYDPCEIYRKILFASNDEDSTLETEDTNNVSVKENNEFINDFNNKSIQIPVQNDSNSFTNSNFSEKHWRKNFTYNYKYNS